MQSLFPRRGNCGFVGNQMKKVSCAQKILSSSLSLPFSSFQTYHPKIMSVFREIFETETGINNSIFSRSTICYRASAVASPVTSKVSNIGICIGLALYFYGKWQNNNDLHWFSIVHIFLWKMAQQQFFALN